MRRPASRDNTVEVGHSRTILVELHAEVAAGCEAKLSLWTLSRRFKDLKPFSLWLKRWITVTHWRCNKVGICWWRYDAFR